MTYGGIDWRGNIHGGNAIESLSKDLNSDTHRNMRLNQF